MYSKLFNNLTRESGRDFNQRSRADTSRFGWQSELGSNSKSLSFNSKTPINNRRSFMVINNQLVIIIFLYNL